MLIRIAQEWLLKDRERHERSIPVDRNTHRSGSRPRIGEEIEDSVDSEGHGSTKTIDEQ